MKKLLISCSLLFSVFCHAQEIPNATKQEVEHLFAHLDNSGCQFNRNGSWYSAHEAVLHIRKKYDYLLGKKLINTTESFIEKAATESSMSGKPYQVKCKGQTVALSSIWLKNELKNYRTKKTSKEIKA
jgi:Family of unknown function (DUF5329)